jgi:glyoxylase-like metal-dependent hydrolase (beta-lactamase superfamily II)
MAAATLVVVVLSTGVDLPAQSGRGQEVVFRSAPLEVLRLQSNVYMVAGAGSNIVVQAGPDGLVLVDAGSGALSAGVLAALKKLSDLPVRYIIDTSADADHVGGNASLAQVGEGFDRAPGAVTVGHERVLLRMSAPTGQKSPFAFDVWPKTTYLEKKDLYLNGEAIRLVHRPAAHTDGDTIVFFRRSDVLATGDIFDQTRFPVIDVSRGGSVQGEIAALNVLVDIAVTPTPLPWQEGGTMVVPGHGRVAESAELVEYRDMVTIIRDVIADMIKRGMTLDQIKAADPTKGFTPEFGSSSGAWTTDMFVEAVYKSLTAKK